MSLWEYFACVKGFNRANGVKDKVKPPTIEEHQAMLERHGLLN